MSVVSVLSALMSYRLYPVFISDQGEDNWLYWWLQADKISLH